MITLIAYRPNGDTYFRGYCEGRHDSGFEIHESFYETEIEIDSVIKHPLRRLLYVNTQLEKWENKWEFYLLLDGVRVGFEHKNDDYYHIYKPCLDYAQQMAKETAARIQTEKKKENSELRTIQEKQEREQYEKLKRKFKKE